MRAPWPNPSAAAGCRSFGVFAIVTATILPSMNAGSSPGLLAWQWEGYARYHQSRTNLLMHIVLVPLFLAGNVALVVGAIRFDWIEAVAGLALMAISMALQGRGHRSEPVPPVPFSSAGNA